MAQAFRFKPFVSSLSFRAFRFEPVVSSLSYVRHASRSPLHPSTAWEKLLFWDMALNSRLLASGPGWSVSDVVCTAGPHDRPFEERHHAACIAAVTQGTFQYRSAQGSAVLAPGAVLLGNEGTCFECGHEHGTGDRCLAFHFAPDHLEAIVAAMPGGRRTAFAVARLPPLPSLIPLIAAAEAAREGAELEELALRLAGAAAMALASRQRTAHRPSPRDERRVTDALRRIEAQAHEQLTLADLAREAAMSPYHFLRTFREVAGMTPYQFVLRTRLHRAAVLLRRSDASISTIAFDAGFSDLSTFNRRFRRVMGSSPRAYRARGRMAGRR
jgi:AraC family transcriptional regulator